MTQRPQHVLVVFGAVALIAACSLTVPSENDLFGGLASAGRSNASGASGASGEAGEETGGGAPNGGASAGRGNASAGANSGTAGGGGGSVAQGGGDSGFAGIAEPAGNAGDAGGGGGPSTPPPVYGVQNPSFEKGSLVGWTITPATAVTSGAVYPRFPPVGDTPPHDGSWQLSTWLEKEAYVATITQVVNVPEDGTYTLSGYFTMHTGIKSVEFFARNCGGEPVAPLPLQKIASWQESRITGIEVVGGECEIGFSVEAEANQWLNADSFSFEKESP